MPSYDSAERRKSKRNGRERGCWVYIPAEELLRAGYDSEAEPPRYRIWPTGKGRVLLQLYKDTDD
jgi:hypothetical protein